VSTTTVRISPPKPPKRKRSRNAAPSPREDLERFLRTYKGVLIPYAAALWVGLIARLVIDDPWRFAYFAGLAAAVDVAASRVGYRVGMKVRKVYRFPSWLPETAADLWARRAVIYGYAVPWSGALWGIWSTADSTIEPFEIVYLVILTAVTAAPWWKYIAVRDSVVVTFDSLSRPERDARLRECKSLVNDWKATTAAALLPSAKLRGIDFTPHSVGVRVTLRRGMSSARITRRVKESISSAFPWRVPTELIPRIVPDPEDSQTVTIRLILRDLHAEPFSAPLDEEPTIENCRIGLFESGAPVWFRFVNTLIAGATGQGKSSVINRIIQAVMKIPTVALLGVDCTPGSTELRPWEDVFHVVVGVRETIDKLFDSVLAEMDRRGEIMSRNRWKNWRVTRQDPFMLLIIDEVADIKRLKLHGKLDKIVSQIRKYGGAVVIATQHPKDTSVPTTITINCVQKIGLKTETESADRVIFGGNATRQGWSPSTLIPEDRKGSFLIRSEIYGRPELARCDWVGEADIDRDVETWSPQRTPIDTITLTPVTAARVQSTSAGELEAGSVMTLEAPAEEIFEAEIVVDEIDTMIMDCLDRNVRTPTLIQKDLEENKVRVTSRTVSNRLGKLKENGYVTQRGSRAPWFRA
jgi:hypothetical protein